MKRPLILVSGLRASEARQVLPWLRSVKRPMLLEATSRLRGEASLHDYEVLGAEKTLARLQIDGVIRIGGVPTTRFWRDLEKSDMPVRSFSSLPFSGLPRAREVSGLNALSELAQFEDWNPAERFDDREIDRARRELMQQFPLSEMSWMHWLSQQIPSAARVFLGNSLPIREWDEFAARQAARDIFASRGTNGIDGLVSTFAGVADENLSNWCVIGDLSALYDQAGLWALRQRPIADFNLVVINNSGGQIFNRIFRDPMFLNAHELDFAPWAKMWGVDYQHLQSEQQMPAAHAPRVLEIVPDARQTEAFWNAWDKL